MIKMLHKIWKSNGLLKSAAQLFSGMFPVFIINFIFIIIIERKFTNQDGLFSSFETVRSVLEMIIFTVGSVFSPAITRYVGVLLKDNRKGDIAPFLKKWINQLIFISILLIVICFILGDQLSEVLKIDNTVSIYLIGILSLGFLIQPLINGALIGLQKFSNWSIGMVLGASARLLFGILLVMLISDLQWALFCYGVGFFVTVIYGGYILRNNLNNFRRTDYVLPDIKSYLGISLLIFISYAIFLRGDVVLAKMLFNSSIADEFAKVALLGHFVIFIPSVFTGAMMPKVIGEGIGFNSDQSILSRTLFISSLSAILFALFIHFLGSFLYHIIFNALPSDEAVWWLRGIAWSMVPVCLLNSVMKYALMRKLFKRTIIIVLMSIVFVSISLLKINSPMDLIILLFLTSAIATITLVISIFWFKKNK